MIKIEHLTKTYAGSEIKAVDGVSFSVNPGEIVGFVGPNGAGKSTTIKCITGILPFEEGRITICDKDIGIQPVDAKRNMAYVADENILYNGLNGKQYISLIADIFGVEKKLRDERTDKYSILFDMSDKLGDKISSYSHGMKQKISIIAGLIHEPKVWILDEPMTGLDPKASFELKKLMKEHAEKGNSVLFSSHVLEVVEKLCHKVVIINKGKIITECTAEELQEKSGEMGLEEFFLKITGVFSGENI